MAVYDITQWARIFTIGMFYTFTMKLNLSIFSNRFLTGIQGIILAYGTWVMVCILIIEGLLFYSYWRKIKAA